VGLSAPAGAFGLDAARRVASGERVVADTPGAGPQQGGFYAGWITNDGIGPFKGSPGTLSC
jgi:hypothetical protein